MPCTYPIPVPHPINEHTHAILSASQRTLLMPALPTRHRCKTHACKRSTSKNANKDSTLRNPELSAIRPHATHQPRRRGWSEGMSSCRKGLPPPFNASSRYTCLAHHRSPAGPQSRSHPQLKTPSESIIIIIGKIQSGHENHHHSLAKRKEKKRKEQPPTMSQTAMHEIPNSEMKMVLTSSQSASMTGIYLIYRSISREEQNMTPAQSVFYLGRTVVSSV